MTGFNQYHFTPEHRWQTLLQQYCDCQKAQRRLLQFRALSHGVLLFSIALLLFLLDANAQYYGELLFIAMLGMLLSLPLALYSQWALGKAIRQHKQIAQAMFSAGLRVDDDKQLVTNTAHAKLIARLGNPVLEQ
ncbi:MAG: hypothetical protein ACNA75_02710 [Thiohalomonadaceae bacterium]